MQVPTKWKIDVMLLLILLQTCSTWDELKLNAVFDSPTMQDILEHNYQLLKKHAGKNKYEPLLSTLYNKQIEDKPFELEKDTQV